MRRINFVIWGVVVVVALLLLAPRLQAEKGDRPSPAGVTGNAPALSQEAAPAGAEAGVAAPGSAPAAVEVSQEAAPAASQVQGGPSGAVDASAAQVDAASDPAAAGVSR